MASVNTLKKSKKIAYKTKAQKQQYILNMWYKAIKLQQHARKTTILVNFIR
ncbi:hypothetical protein LDG_6629 [Legionella drancourtii LLAP12]|uniref:Uncharacterized protein n=1 Tax=Legionella drancourtii LLAP12 TaxID=658187 RepID=G9EN09_9GAMM|nr:hypothetical protein LDG_6629 [Legionella drancourtii LLAP12]